MMMTTTNEVRERIDPSIEKHVFCLEEGMFPCMDSIPSVSIHGFYSLCFDSWPLFGSTNIVDVFPPVKRSQLFLVDVPLSSDTK